MLQEGTANIPSLLYRKGVKGAQADMICCELLRLTSPDFVEAIERLVAHGYTPERIGDGTREASRMKREKPNEATIANAMSVARHLQREK